MDLIRVWKELDAVEIEKHLIIVDDIQGFCPSCKNPGIKYDDMKKCSSCGTEFKYITTRDNIKSHKAASIVNKIKKHVPDLVFIDYSDYKHALDKNKAKDLFSI